MFQMLETLLLVICQNGYSLADYFSVDDFLERVYWSDYVKVI